jgi:MFS family permease
MAGGLGLTGIGLLLMGGLGMSSGWTALLAGFVIGGIGIGLLNPVVADVALSVVPKERSGMAAGINDTFRQVGVAVGTAAWGAIFLGVGASKTQSLAGGAVDHGQARELVEATSSGALPQALRAVPANARDNVRRATEEGFLHGLNEILLIGGILCLIGTGFALWLVREREIDRSENLDAPLEAEPVPAQV